MLTLLGKLLKAFNSDSSPNQVALAFALSLFVALTPWLSLHNIIVVFLVLVLNVNVSAFMFGVLALSLVGYAVGVWSHQLGEWLLTSADLQPTWTQLYQSDIWRMTEFNHTLTLGGFVIALALFIPMWVVMRFLVIKYRARFLVWINRFKVVKMIKASGFYSLFKNLAD